MPNWFSFDDDKLKNLLLSTAREGFCKLKRQFSDEKFYCFALYSHESYSFVYTAVSSEQGLTRAAEKHVAHAKAENQNWFNGLNLDQVRAVLRHDIADSAIQAPVAIFKEVCELAETRSTLIYNKWCEIANRAGEQAAFEAVRPHNQKFLDMCFDVLHKLDREGLFGKTRQRHRVVVNFLTASQSRDEMVCYARSLNPPAVAKRYEQELVEAATYRCPEAHHDC